MILANVLHLGRGKTAAGMLRERSAINRIWAAVNFPVE